MRGNREIFSLTVGDSASQRPASGRRGAKGDDARAGEVRPRHSSDEACEQGRETGGGVGGAKGGDRGEHTGQSRTRRTQSRCSVSQGLDRVRNAAKQRKKERFTALLHHVTVDLLRDAFLALKRRAAPGVDGVTWQDYEAKLEDNLRELHARVQRGTYRARPVRRRFIPKADGNQRPLGITAVEDKIVQRAVVTVLKAIYEEDFLGFSYGFRPGRS
jgi:RNA-directed DNA polymerase